MNKNQDHTLKQLLQLSCQSLELAEVIWQVPKVCQNLSLSSTEAARQELTSKAASSLSYMALLVISESCKGHIRKHLNTLIAIYSVIKT